MAVKTHNYKKDPQSGAGNCVCGGGKIHVLHPHKFTKAVSSTKGFVSVKERTDLCVCSKPEEHIIHFI